MKQLHTFESFLNESKYKGNISGDAAEYIAKELSQYVKGIISQPNDNVTYFHLKDKSDKSKVIKTLLDIYGLEAVDGGNMFSPSPTIKFDNDQLLESSKGVSQEAYTVHSIIQCGQDSAQDFIDDNNIDAEKLVAYLKRYSNSKEKYDVRDLIKDPASNKKLLKQFLNEGYMSELDIIRQESKTVDDFIKNAKKDFPQIAKMKDADAFLSDLWEMGKQMKESFNFQLTAHSKAAADVAEAIEKNAKFVNENDMAELLSVYANTLKKTGYLGLDNFK